MLAGGNGVLVLFHETWWCEVLGQLAFSFGSFVGVWGCCQRDSSQCRPVLRQQGNVFERVFPELPCAVLHVSVKDTHMYTQI